LRRGTLGSPLRWVVAPMRRYSLREVPERTDGGSRYALSSSPAGWGSDPRTQLVSNLDALLAEMVSGAAQLTPELVEVEVKKIVVSGDGYSLVSLGVVQAPQRFPSRRAGKFSGLLGELGCGRALDGFFLGKEAFSSSRGLRDPEAWDCALAVAEFHALDQAQASKLSEVVARALLFRAGADVKDIYELSKLLVYAKPAEAVPA
jgi:hypothetical protein